MTYTVDESGEMHQVDIDEVVERHGAALVIRSSKGRAGERAPPWRDERVLDRTHPRRRGLPR